jgi:hypothetical protein
MTQLAAQPICTEHGGAKRLAIKADFKSTGKGPSRLSSAVLLCLEGCDWGETSCSIVYNSMRCDCDGLSANCSFPQNKSEETRRCSVRRT